MGFLFFMGSPSKVVVMLLGLVCWVNLMSSNGVLCIEYEVGGKQGWATPSSKDTQLYNEWASRNRFLVNDTLHFLYQKDSVLEVTNEEYEKCKSSHPIFFSNNGDTDFILNRPGLFYFISGVSGHCERGLKMIIKAREPPFNATSAPPHKKNGAVHLGRAVSSFSVVVVMLVSFFGALFA